MLAVFAESIFLQVDVTYPGTNAFPYMLNFVTYNEGTLMFQTVDRVLMNRLTVASYKVAFKKVFECVTNVHPEFEHGAHVKAFIVDYSLAQHSGLSSAIGERALEMIRGCSVHYQRMAKKVAEKVASNDRSSKEVLLKIAYKIPHLEDRSHVNLAFDVLCGAATRRRVRVYEFHRKRAQRGYRKMGFGF